MMVTLDKPARVHWRLPRSVGIDRLLLLLAVLFIWQVLTWIAGPEVIMSPPATARKLAAFLNAPDFVGHAYDTCRAFAAALIISLLGGLVVGLAPAPNASPVRSLSHFWLRCTHPQDHTLSGDPAAVGTRRLS